MNKPYKFFEEQKKEAYEVIFVCRFLKICIFVTRKRVIHGSFISCKVSGQYCFRK